MHGADAPKTALSLDSAVTHALHWLFANIRGQTDFWERTCDIGNRLCATAILQQDRTIVVTHGIE